MHGSGAQVISASEAAPPEPVFAWASPVGAGSDCEHRAAYEGHERAYKDDVQRTTHEGSIRGFTQRIR